MMTVGRTTCPWRSRTRIGCHPSRYCRTWARDDNTSQPSHTDKGFLKSATSIELGASDPSGHALWGPLTSYSSGWLMFEAKQNALQNNLSTWGPKEPRSWSLTEAGEGTSCPNIQGEHLTDIYEDQGRLSLHPLEVADWLEPSHHQASAISEAN